VDSGQGLSLRQHLTELQQQYRQQRWRLPLWLQVSDSAEPQWLAQTLAELLTAQQQAAGFWLGELVTDCVLPAQTSRIKHKGQLLGVEANWIVINGLAGIDWDLLAASSGCLRAGGLWLLITSTPEQFALQANPQAQRLLSYPLQALEQPSKFQQFWLSQQQDWWLHHHELGLHRQPVTATAAMSTETTAETTAATAISTETIIGHETTFDAAPAPTAFANQEQQQAVAAILKVVSGHRRRPLLLTAHRGRGKSAALGIAAAQLQQMGKTTLIITAPQPAAAAVALKHAAAALAEIMPSAAVTLQFWPVDALLQQTPAADLVMVDEAAAIPLPQLQLLTQHYSRLVFATTEHGYEGTGRSFSLKFQPYLQQHCPGWRQLQLQQPIRYASDDPLERQIFRSFLLACDQPTPVYDPVLPLQTRFFAADELLAQPSLLQSLFGLLSLAHYQTEISDLWALLDNPQLQLMALYQTALPSEPVYSSAPSDRSVQLLGCAVISHEGQLPLPLATAVYQGERRVQGHLLAQSLAFHLAQPALATLPLARVQRIVIHPVWQHQGLGRFLLQAVEAYCREQGSAAIGSSFGVTPTLLKFWTHQGFHPVKLSAQSEQTSGEPSLLMLKSCSTEHEQTVALLQQQFATDLYWQLADSQRHLQPLLALQLCQPPHRLHSGPLDPLPDKFQDTLAATSAVTPAATSLRLSESHRQQLQLFAHGKRPYELVELILLDWFEQYRHQVPTDIAQLLVQKLWQKQSWSVLSKPQLGIGKPQLVTLIRQAVAEFLLID
jgi:tRNA(Met) cytidine acetyltransferase